MDWKILSEIVRPVNLILLIVIFWLMRQNSQLVSQIFNTHANIARLTSLLESLVLDKKGV